MSDAKSDLIINAAMETVAELNARALNAANEALSPSIMGKFADALTVAYGSEDAVTIGNTIGYVAFYAYITAVAKGVETEFDEGVGRPGALAAIMERAKEDEEQPEG